MRHDFLDCYSRLESPLHRTAANVKLSAALGVVVLTAITPLTATWFFVAVAAALVSVAIVARIPFGYLGKRLLMIEPFVLGVAVLTLLQPNGRVVFLGIVVRSTLCLLTMVLLANTTPFGQLLAVLKQARVPALFVTTLALLYRYLFVLADEAERMQRARAARSFTRRRWHGWKVLATVAGQLFVRSTERAERIYAAMLARGWK